MTQFKNFLDKQVENKLPPSIEEQSRKNRFPQTCTEECTNRTCGFYRIENFGKPCAMRFEQYKNENMPPQSKPDPNESLLRNLEIAIAKAKKPALDRLKAIEAQDREPITRSFLNGTHPKYYPSLAIGTNQERICYD